MSLKRLTDLFEEGMVLQVVANDGSVIPFWIAKPNPFDEEEAVHEARTSRARLMLAIKEVGTPEYQLFQASLGEMSEPDMVEYLVGNKTLELTAKAIREVQSDTDWSEKIRLVEQSSEQLKDSPDDDPEVIAIKKVSEDASDEIDRRTQALIDELRSELRDLPRERLIERTLEDYAERRGLQRFTDVKVVQQVWMCLRQCMGTQTGGKWDHSECDHSTRWLERAEDVKRMPPAFFRQVKAAYDSITIDADTARFSEGPASSSASSGPASTQEDSKASGPVETPGGPAST